MSLSKNVALAGAFVSAVSAFAAIAIARRGKTPAEAPPSRILLPKAVRPSHYQLSLTPDLDKSEFTGTESITIDVLEPTRTIVLHSKELVVSDTELVIKTTGASHVPVALNHDETQDLLTLTFAEVIPAGAAILNLAFTGKLNDSLAGFYRSKYAVGEGAAKVERFMAVTQFEPNDARRAFPCWDEPATKATFDVELVVPADRVALSNMPVLSDTPVDGARRAVRFQRTPIMSTYLLAFIVGELEYIEGVSKAVGGVEGSKDKTVRVYTTPGYKDEGRFALDVAVRTLAYFESYFGTAYPLPKLDMIAVPDFAAGAMENWGLVTYRVTAVLFNEEKTPTHLRQRVAEVVAHELAHQWFGNLVTMEWWTHLWLNEGFATWVGTLAVDHLFPEWKIWDSFIVDDVQRALELDGLRSSHPIEVEIYNSHQVDEIFDAISYSKGASVIRMLVNWIGEKAFRTGLKKYLDEHRYKNASTDDLWRALSESSGQNVEEVMGVWTRTQGYPVLRVERGPADNSLRIAQKRYLSTGPKEASADPTVWPVPLVINSADNKGPINALVKDAAVTVDLPASTKPWVKVNAGCHGFYRTLYSGEMFKDLVPVIPTMMPADRIDLVNDYFAFAEAGYIPTSQALMLVTQMADETEYAVWRNLALYLGELQHALSDQPPADQDALRALQRSLYTPLALRLGWDRQPGESHLQSLLRELAVGRAGRLGDERIVSEARKRFERIVRGDDKAVTPDLKSAVYGTVLTHGGEEDYEQLVALYERLEASDQKLMVLGQLGAAPSPVLVRRALEYSLTDKVRLQDFFYVLNSAASNRHGRSVMWDFVREKWPTLAEKFTGFLITRIVSISVGAFASELRAQEATEFFAAHPHPGIEMSVRQAIEKVRCAAAWGTRDRADIATFLAARASA